MRGAGRGWASPSPRIMPRRPGHTPSSSIPLSSGAAEEPGTGSPRTASRSGLARSQGESDDEPRRLQGGWSCDPPQYFHIVILDSLGHEVLNDAGERVERRDMSHPPPARPYLEQLFVDPPNDRLIARVAARGSQWWVYRLSTGKLQVDAETGAVLSERPFQRVDTRIRLYWTDTPRVRASQYLVMRPVEDEPKNRCLWSVDLTTGATQKAAAL
jgi:hypothetical protein